MATIQEVLNKQKEIKVQDINFLSKSAFGIFKINSTDDTFDFLMNNQQKLPQDCANSFLIYREIKEEANGKDTLKYISLIFIDENLNLCLLSTSKNL